MVAYHDGSNIYKDILKISVLPRTSSQDVSTLNHVKQEYKTLLIPKEAVYKIIGEK